MILKYFQFLFGFSILLNATISKEQTDSVIKFTTNSTKNIFLSLNNAKCHKCKLTNLGEINYLVNLSLTLSTFYPEYFIYFKIIDTNEQICKLVSKSPINLNENFLIKFQLVQKIPFV